MAQISLLWRVAGAAGVSFPGSPLAQQPGRSLVSSSQEQLLASSSPNSPPSPPLSKMVVSCGAVSMR